LDEVVSPVAYYITESTPCGMDSIERVHAYGSTAYPTNYCNAEGSDYDGYVYDGDGNAISADDDEESCYSAWGIYYYDVDIDDDAHIYNESYIETAGTRIVKFRYKSGGTFYYTVITFNSCLE
jgi:hypothetical protein